MHQRTTRSLVFICAVTANLWGTAAAQTSGGGISLSPAVVELKGSAGQAHRQTLSLTNSTQVPLAFELLAEDIVIENGQRSFLSAGQRADSQQRSPPEPPVPPHCAPSLAGPGVPGAV